MKFRKKWELALWRMLIDQARGWKLPDRIVVADAGYGDVTTFREALETRNLRYAVGVQSTMGVWVEPPRPRKLKPKEDFWPAAQCGVTHFYGKQRPVAAKEVAATGPRVEEGSLAGRQERLAGVSLLDGPACSGLRTDFMRAASQAKRSGC